MVYGQVSNVSIVTFQSSLHYSMRWNKVFHAIAFPKMSRCCLYLKQTKQTHWGLWNTSVWLAYLRKVQVPVYLPRLRAFIFLLLNSLCIMFCFITGITLQLTRKASSFVFVFSQDNYKDKWLDCESKTYLYVLPRVLV